jgi:hypothetical protein
VNLCVLYYHKLIDKLTVSLQLQEFRFDNILWSVPLPSRGVVLTTREKKKRKILNVIFFLFVRKTISTVQERV